MIEVPDNIALTYYINLYHSMFSRVATSHTVRYKASPPRPVDDEILLAQLAPGRDGAESS